MQDDVTPAVSLESLFAEGVPKPPIEDFERLVASIQDELLAAKRHREAEEAETLRLADKLVEDLRAEVDRTHGQIRVLEGLRVEFVALGENGGTGLEAIRDALAVLDAHARTLESRLRHPELQRANERRLERIRQLKERLPEKLRPDVPADDAEDALGEILRLGLPPDDPLLVSLIESFEAGIRERGALDALPVAARLWKAVARRAGDAVASPARDRAQAIEREIAEREARREANERAIRDALDIRTAAEGLDRLGPEEQYAQLALWLGRLRRYQDAFDLEPEAAREVYFTFGALNTARKRFGVEGYFDAFDRSYSTNWERYVAEWEKRLVDARRKDQLDREEERRREAERKLREREDAEEAEAQRARVEAVVQELSALAGHDDAWKADADSRDEIREILIAGVEADGCANPAFVDAAVPFAPLAQGNELRRLRRALAKRGVEVDASALPNAAELPDAALAPLRPRWEGRRLAIVGGLPRPEIADRVRTGLGFREVRWFECFRDRDQLDQAEASIRAGAFDQVLLLIRFSGHEINRLREPCDAAGVPFRIVDRGCGVKAIARALEGA